MTGETACPTAECDRLAVLRRAFVWGDRGYARNQACQCPLAGPAWSHKTAAEIICRRRFFKRL